MDKFGAISVIQKLAAEYDLAVSIVTAVDVLLLKGIQEPTEAQIATVVDSWEFRHYGDNWTDWFEGFIDIEDDE